MYVLTEETDNRHSSLTFVVSNCYLIGSSLKLQGGKDA